MYTLEINYYKHVVEGIKYNAVINVITKDYHIDDYKILPAIDVNKPTNDFNWKKVVIEEFLDKAYLNGNVTTPMFNSIKHVELFLTLYLEVVKEMVREKRETFLKQVQLPDTKIVHI